MANLRWQVGEVEVTQLVEMVDNELFSTFIPEAKPESILKIDWLQPDFIDPQGKLKAQVQSFLIKSEGKNILIDTCNGNDKNRPNVPTWGNLHTTFLDGLTNVGMSPENIDTVICTHLHFDHVGWNTMLANGQWVPTFPNATYLISQEEYNYWIKRPEKEMIDDFNGIDDSVTPIVNAGLVKFITDDYRLDSSIRLIPTPGHTPRHASVLIESAGFGAIITGDVMHHPCQIAYPEWTTLADTYPNLTVQTRKKFLNEVADKNTLIIGSHFANPVAGWIVSDQDKYKFNTKDK